MDIAEVLKDKRDAIIELAARYGRLIFACLAQ